MEDEKIKEVLTNRLKREINLALEGRKLSIQYIAGYREAISNILWDLYEECIMLEPNWLELIKQGKKIKIELLDTSRKIC